MPEKERKSRFIAQSAMAQSTSLREPTRSQEANAGEKASARSARNDSVWVVVATFSVNSCGEGERSPRGLSTARAFRRRRG
jgi:hypothetical protein